MKVLPLYESKSLNFFSVSTESTIELPLYEIGVKAGFPSPAEDFPESRVDLNKALIRNPESTFLCRVDGDSMKDIGIFDGDLLVVDKSIEPRNGKVAICYIDGEFTLKNIKIEKGHCWLVPANKSYNPIQITEENEFMVWGIVTHVIKSF